MRLAIVICGKERMDMEREILLLGNPQLYEVSEEVKREELESLRPVFTDMFDCTRVSAVTMALAEPLLRLRSVSRIVSFVC